MMPMEPGKDGKPWRLCSKCYLDGIRPMHQIGHEPVAPPRAPKSKQDDRPAEPAPKRKKRAS